MSGDPKECRQHALACLRLVQTSASPQARQEFADLARTWIRLADDLERTLVLLDVLEDETEPERRTGEYAHEEAPDGGARACSPGQEEERQMMMAGDHHHSHSGLINPASQPPDHDGGNVGNGDHHRDDHGLIEKSNGCGSARAIVPSAVRLCGD